jgi:hypothetical protein
MKFTLTCPTVDHGRGKAVDCAVAAHHATQSTLFFDIHMLTISVAVTDPDGSVKLCRIDTKFTSGWIRTRANPLKGLYHEIFYPFYDVNN